ncbi:MAG: hypothetical protein ACJAS1_007124 [Oleiphilaceae bacterium]|jgi:hypothetical protein
MQKIEILHSVGKGSKNKAIDVALIQALLQSYYKNVKTEESLAKDKNKKDFSTLQVNGSLSDFLIEAIKQFQTSIVKMKVPDSRIDPRGMSFNKLVSAQTTKPTSLAKTLFGTTTFGTAVLNTIPASRFKIFFKQYYGLTTTKGEDLSGFFEKIKQDSNITSFGWAAYMLATAYHETTFSFKPKSESGKGNGHRYSKVYDVKDVKGIRGKPGAIYKNVYYGRGYVQLTWDKNYKILGKALGIGDKLYINPDLALDPDIAYNITSLGMRDGIFTTKKLSDYITANKVDYLNARRIINGTDEASKIAEYALLIEYLLRLAAQPLTASKK